ncbi:MAG: hypothetical protein ACJATI_001185 [Halioglobus sp.]
MTQDLYEEEAIKVFEFSGYNPTETIGVEYETIVIKDSTTAWEKKKVIEIVFLRTMMIAWFGVLLRCLKK